jgi:hypothetical protein
MFLNLALAIVVAIVTPTAGPTAAPSPGERELPTIITVISSPYCNSLADHFNGALLPMLANDRVLESTSTQLDKVNAMSDSLNYVQLFLEARDNLGREQETLNRSLAGIQRNIVALREGAKLTTDPQATAEITQASWQLQTAYDHQRQLSIDLYNMYQDMLNYPIQRYNPGLGGFNKENATEPEAMRNIKSYLKFDSQRETIDKSEDQAVDTAYGAAQTYCVPKK